MAAPADLVYTPEAPLTPIGAATPMNGPALPTAARVDEAKTAASLGEKLTRPDAAHVRATTGYAIGGVPPLGHDAKMTVMIDEALPGFDVVWAAAGTPLAVFACDPQALMRATGARAMAM
jgi:prolyl-tRNA editing enzyme YbaK/EbsC (Cys-tRNA(Pro) deacylase)